MWDLPIFRYISLPDMKTSILEGKNFFCQLLFWHSLGIRGTSLDSRKCVDTAIFRFVALKSPIDFSSREKNPTPLLNANKIFLFAESLPLLRIDFPLLP